jgi:ubiquitin-protein ligase
MNKRILKEYKDLQKNVDDEITIKPFENNLLLWNAKFIGPKDTPYEGIVFSNFKGLICFNF